MKRSGFADLPLHGGRVPPWLAQRMEQLGTAITESIVYHYGTSEFLSRLSDPFWFQALGSVMGMDWHSSGITTSVLGALKRGVNRRSHELGIRFCGGRGKQSRKTPARTDASGRGKNLNGNELVRTSRLAAKIDNNAIADGFQIYLHGFVISATGEWAIVQQGLNAGTGLARRYHWHSANVADFTREPHTGDRRPERRRDLEPGGSTSGERANGDRGHCGRHPERTIAEITKLTMPRHHDVQIRDVDLKRLGAVLAVSHEKQLRDFASVLLVENLGPRTLQTLALVAEVVHGAPSRFSDPARFSFALGGKDGHPFPVPLKTYDESLSVLRRSLDAAKLGRSEKIDGFKRLDALVRRVESSAAAPEARFQEVLAHERAISPSLGGRTVMDDRRDRKVKAQKQLTLF